MAASEFNMFTIFKAMLDDYGESEIVMMILQRTSTNINDWARHKDFYTGDITFKRRRKHGS